MVKLVNWNGTLQTKKYDMTTFIIILMFIRNKEKEPKDEVLRPLSETVESLRKLNFCNKFLSKSVKIGTNPVAPYRYHQRIPNPWNP